MTEIKKLATLRNLNIMFMKHWLYPSFLLILLLYFLLTMKWYLAVSIDGGITFIGMVITLYYANKASGFAFKIKALNRKNKSGNYHEKSN